MCVEEIYGGTHALLKSVVKGLNIKVITFKPDMLDIPFTLTTKSHTRLIFVETPTNPSLHTIDLGGLMQVAGMFDDAYVCVDNTFATSFFQQPIYQHGVDISLHSTTKYIGGHGDLIGGCATVGAIPRLLHDLLEVKTKTGAIMDPMTAFLNLRGLKTLAVRMKQHTINALTLTSLFDDLEFKHTYPGFGGMVSLDLGSRDNAKKFVEQLVGPKLAVSLGETQTLINVPALMTHATYSDEELKAIGIGPGQIRISVGLEEPCKLKEEFKKALEGV